jgi:hypothetical protein
MRAAGAVDLSMVKRVKVHGDVNFEFRAEMLNAFNSPYFNIASTGGQPLGMTTNYLRAGRARTPTSNNGSDPAANAVSGTCADSYRLTTVARRQHQPHHPTGVPRQVVGQETSIMADG